MKKYPTPEKPLLDIILVKFNIVPSLYVMIIRSVKMEIKVDMSTLYIRMTGVLSEGLKQKPGKLSTFCG